MHWIDTHCHLDAPEFDGDADAVVARARAAGVGMIVLPAIDVGDFAAVRDLAHRHALAYALGIHPLRVDAAAEDDLGRLAAALEAARDDPRLVAVGEIGVDGFMPGLDRDRQRRFYVEQLKLARRAGLPVLLHSRHAVDDVLAGLRRVGAGVGGIAHAFNGSPAQAAAFVDRGLRLGFGGAMTFERAQRIRRLAAAMPAESPVLETDAPDIPPRWLYVNAEHRREAGEPQARNEPREVPRIAETLAELRGWTLDETAHRTGENALAALPRLAALAPVTAATAGPATSGLPANVAAVEQWTDGRAPSESVFPHVGCPSPAHLR